MLEPARKPDRLSASGLAPGPNFYNPGNLPLLGSPPRDARSQSDCQLLFAIWPWPFACLVPIWQPPALLHLPIPG